MVQLEGCPKCKADVEVISVLRTVNASQRTYYFVHCDGCGFGTREAFESKDLLAQKWQAMIDEETHIA